MALVVTLEPNTLSIRLMLASTGLTLSSGCWSWLKAPTGIHGRISLTRFPHFPLYSVVVWLERVKISVIIMGSNCKNNN